MKYSHLFTKTEKTLPAGEEARNAQLLIQAGFIRKEMAGVYSFLPLGLRVLRKIEQIVREEMDKIGCQELLMPSLCPQENWVKTGRWDTVDVLYKLELPNGKEVALSPTHEEIVTPLVQNYLNSPKNFPACVYQFQWKFRNEARAKSGLLRGREFLMKDAYSFHTSVEDFEEYYEAQKQAYLRIYDRLGIGDITYVVAADGGDFSEFSHEFQTISEIGEDLIFKVPGKDVYLNREIVVSKAPAVEKDDKMLGREDVLGEGLIGVDALAEFLKIPVEKTTKTLLLETDDGRVIAAAVRGGYDVDMNKLKKIVGDSSLVLASEETVKRVTGAEVGYAGMLNLPEEVEQFWDDSTENRMNFEMGANETNFHSVNINFGRDLDEPEKFYDFKVPKPGDLHPESGEVYETMKAVEVGNIFPLADKFSKAFNFKSEGKSVTMGCYGIGVTRIMGILAEIFSDEKGLKWPESVAPFQIYLAAIGKSDVVYEKAEEIYGKFMARGIEVFFDDRREKKVGPGQKFADHELMGIPVRVVVSEKLLEDGKCEVVHRDSGEMELVDLDAVVGKF